MAAQRLPIVGVMGSGRDAWEDLARPVGQLVAELGFHLLTGAGRGVMTSVSRAFCEVEPRRGLCLGIVPTTDGVTPVDGYPNEHVEVPVVTPLGNYDGTRPGPTRNDVNILTSTVVVALPGSIGTRNEIELALEHGKPLALFGPADAHRGVDADVPRLAEVEALRAFLAPWRPA